VCLILSHLGMAYGQGTFNKRYGSMFMDYANRAIETSQGDHLVVGRSFGFGSASNAVVMKLDAMGEPIWTRDYAGINADEAFDVLENKAREILVCGGTFSQGAGNWDGFIMKLDSTGNMLWGRTYGNEYGDIIYKLIEAGSGGYLSLGYAQSPSVSGSQGTLLMKLDANGDVLWERYVLDGWTPQQQGWHPHDVALFPDGDILLTSLNSANGNHLNLWRITSTGQVVWSRAYFVRSQGHRLAVDGAGNIYVTCLELEGVALSLDMAVLKLDGSGNVLWFKSYGGTYMDKARDIIIASDGDPVICGLTNSSGHGDYDAFLLKINGNGAVQWCKTYGGVWPDIPGSLHETHDRGFIMAGETYSFGTNPDSLKMYVVRTDSLGNTSCNSMDWELIQMDGSVTPLTPMILSALQQQQGSITWPSNHRTFSTASICDVTSISGSGERDARISVHPNPFDRSIGVSLPQGSNAGIEIRVTDLLGRAVFEYRDPPTLLTGTRNFDLGHLPSGVYLMVVRIDEQASTLRIVKE
jgi:hypothetical protein